MGQMFEKLGIHDIRGPPPQKGTRSTSGRSVLQGWEANIRLPGNLPSLPEPCPRNSSVITLTLWICNTPVKDNAFLHMQTFETTLAPAPPSPFPGSVVPKPPQGAPPVSQEQCVQKQSRCSALLPWFKQERFSVHLSKEFR